MTSPSIVRVATPEDEEGLMNLCRSLHDENGAFQMEDDLVRGKLHQAFRKEGTTLGVIGPANKPEAAICLSISTFWYSREKHIEELFNYVLPEHRKSHHAKALLKFAKKCADDLGIVLSIGVISTTQTGRKLRLYQSIFGYPIGAFFLYNSPWAREKNSPGDEVMFWDNPFPRKGIVSVPCKGLSQPDIAALSALRNKAVKYGREHPNGQ